MEDAHTIVLSMEKHQDAAFFGVYDGHCGSACSFYCAENVYQYADEVPDFSDLDASPN